MAFYPNERIALFIDGANLFSTTKALNQEIDFKKLLTYFNSKGRLIAANYYSAVYEHDDYSAIQPLLDWLDSRYAKPPVLADELRRQCNGFIDLVDLEKIIGRSDTDTLSSIGIDET